MNKLSIKTTQKKQILDITDRVQAEIDKSKAKDGLGHLFILHTTAAVTTADLDPGTDQDMLDAFEEIMPKLNYRHPHNPDHVGDHIMSSMVGPEISVPIENGKLVLGTWQRIVLVELDGPRDRSLILTLPK